MITMQVLTQFLFFVTFFCGLGLQIKQQQLQNKQGGKKNLWIFRHDCDLATLHLSI